MQNDNNLIQDLKFRFNNGGMHMKLIFINVIVFLVIGITNVIGRLIPAFENSISEILEQIFTLQASFSGFIRSPWGLFTSIFSHFGFLHILFNMLFLYFAGKMLEQFFGGKRLLYIYIFGGLAGGIFEIIAHEIFPQMATQASVVVGASGSIMAIFMALAFYKPNMQVMLFGVFPVRLIFLALAYLLYDALSLGLNDGTAHFAHLGGAILGFLSMRNPHSSRNFLYRVELFFDRIGAQLKGTSKPKKVKLTYSQGGGEAKKTDYEYNADKKANQERTDVILDKISKSGYESLTKAEKEFLFNQSKK